MILLRLIARMIAFLLLAVLALAGLTAAVFSIATTRHGLSITGLAHDAHLSQLRVTVGRFLARMETDGAIAVIAALSGTGAMLLGGLLVLGALGSRRERLIELDDDGKDGRTTARRRPLAQVASALAEQVRGVTDVDASARSGRRHGSVRVKVAHAAHVDPARLHDEVESALATLTAAGLRTKVQERRGERGARVS